MTISSHHATGLRTILWHVECQFDSDFEPDSENAVPTVNWTVDFEEEVLEDDTITGDPITTEPGEKLLVTVQRALPVLEVVRQEAYPYDPNTILNYVNFTNSQDFYGAPTGCALMASIDVREQKKGSGERVNIVTYRIRFKLKKDPDDPDTFLSDRWQARVLHEGQLVRDAPGAPPKRATDGPGNLKTVNLTAVGTELPEGFDKVYLAFNRYPKVDFNILNLGPY